MAAPFVDFPGLKSLSIKERIRVMEESVLEQLILGRLEEEELKRLLNYSIRKEEYETCQGIVNASSRYHSLYKEPLLGCSLVELLKQN